MNIRTETNEKEAASAATAALAEALRASKGTPTLFLASGGSALSLLDDVAPFRGVEPSSLTIAPLDERFTRDTENQNTHQLKATPFVEKMIAGGAAFFSAAPRGNETLLEAADRFERFLREWKERHPNACTVATLGIGADGHTAGILPFEDERTFDGLFVSTEQWVCGYRHPSARARFAERITPTIPFLSHELDDVIVFAVSEEKCRGALGTLVRGTDAALHALPARLLREHSHATLFTDCRGS